MYSICDIMSIISELNASQTSQKDALRSKPSHSSVHFDDDISISSVEGGNSNDGGSVSSAGGFSFQSASGLSFKSLTSSMISDNNTIVTRQSSSASVSTNARLENEKFLRKKYLEKRSKRLKARLQDRPFDQRALAEYSEVLYEQENFVLAQKVIRRLLNVGDNSGYWHLKLGKCCYRRWLLYRTVYGRS